MKNCTKVTKISKIEVLQDSDNNVVSNTKRSKNNKASGGNMKQKLNLSLAVIAALMGFTTTTHAAGFALIEQSASGMGNAYAGVAASAEDASTIFFNPAGMTYIEGTQMVGALHLIKPTGHFDNNGSVAANSVFAPGSFRPLGSEGGDIGDLAFVPNLYFKTDITENLKAGIGINAPFGLKTEYDKDWIGRFQAVKSELKTININPSLAFKVNDQLSLGLGVSAMWAQAELTSAVNFGPFGEGFTKLKGDDWGFGFNLGAIYQATPDTRLGLAYRSKIDQHIDGDVKFTRPAGLSPLLVNATPNGGAKADISLPETLSLSAFSKVNDTWDVMGDVTWTRWSRLQELAAVRTDGALAGRDILRVKENWSNTLRYSIGATYHYSEKLKLRAGLAYDEEALGTETRTARIPGNDRKWVSLGLGYQMTPASRFDLGYAHLFVSEAKIDDNQTAIGATNPLSKGRVKGEYDASVDILSVQLTHNF